MSGFDLVLESLVNGWRDEDIPIRPGVTQREIADFETRWQVSLPSDMRKYFITVDGTGLHYDMEGFSRFWPLGEVQPVELYVPELLPLLPQSAGYFCFFDHSIDIFLYAIQLGDADTAATPIALIYPQLSEPELQLRFHSFTEFLTLYAADWGNVL